LNYYFDIVAVIARSIYRDTYVT